MLSRLANIFRVPDLRNKVIFTLAIIALYQIGANIPVPGVNWSRLQTLESSASSSGVLGFLNLFSGGALVRLAVFGLGVMPYITSSIIIQLLSTVIPKLEEWRDQGAVGQKKITQTTRYLTVGLAVMQSSGLVYAFHGHDSALLGTNIDLIPTFNWPLALFMVLILTAGTAMVMWLAELITQRGIGQGMSILIFANVVAAIPTGFKAIYEEGGKVKFGIIIAISLILLVFIVFMDQGQRRIPGDLRPPRGGPTHVRGELDLHPPQGQPVRRDPDHLRQLRALHPGPAVERRPLGLVPELRAQQPDADQLLLHRSPTSC